MSGFEAYAIIDPVVHNLEKKPEWWWKISPPNAADELEMAKFIARKRTKVLADGTVEESLVTAKEVMFREIAVTFGGTNIPADFATPLEDGGEPFLQPTETVDEIERKLGRLPDPVLKEIWTAIGEAFPEWGPKLPN